MMPFTWVPELVGGGCARLVGVALEVGGRWVTEAATVLRLLSRHKTQHLPSILRLAARDAWILRWAAHVSAAAIIVRMQPPPPSSFHKQPRRGPVVTSSQFTATAHQKAR